MSSRYSKPLPPLPLPELPNEIWLKIAGELTLEGKKHLFSLNRTFYDLYMNEKYRNLTLVSTDSVEFVQTMETLKESEVAKRVRALTFWPEPVLEAIYSTKPEGKRVIRVPVNSVPTVDLDSPVPPLDARLGRSENRLEGLKRLLSKKRPPLMDVPAAGPPPVQYRFVELPPLPPHYERFRMFKKVLLTLTGVEEVSVKYYANSGCRDYRQQNLRRDLAVIMHEHLWPTVKDTVRKLSLDVDESSFSDIVPSLPEDPLNIRHFELKLWSLESEVERSDADEWKRRKDAVTSDVVSFVRILNRRSNQLESVSLQTGSRGVWNAIYSLSLSNLQSLQLPLTEGMMMRGPRDCGIHLFLPSSSAGIQHLSLVGSDSTDNNFPSEHGEEGLFDDSAWRSATADFRPFKVLTSLEIRLPDRVSQYARMFKYLAHLAPNLESLEVQDEIGSCKELRVMLESFTGTERRKRKLRELRVRVRILTPDVLKCIFSRCTGLGKLGIVYEVLRPLEESAGMECMELGKHLAQDKLESDELLFLPLLDGASQTMPRTLKEGPDFPAELWLHIAGMLEPEERHKLIGLNRLCFELVMNERYRNLSLVSSDGYNLLETMERLLIPGIANRVRSLTIWSEDVCLAIWPAKFSIEPGPRYELSPHQIVPVPEEPESIWSAVKRRVFREDKPPPERRYIVRRYPVLPDSPGRLQLFKQALGRITNLEELSIKRRVRLNGNRRPIPSPEQMALFLANCMQECIWPVARETVRKLTLDVDSQFFEGFVPAPDVLPQNIRHFVLRLWSNANANSEENLKMSSNVALFVRKLSEAKTGTSGLEKLSLEGDCQAFWSTLGTIPNLRGLELYVPAQVIVQRPTQDTDLHRLLMKNAESIQHLSIIPMNNTPQQPHLSSNSIDASAEPRLIQVGAVASQTLPNLKSLKFKFPWRGRESETLEWRIALEYFTFLGKNATSLTIQDSLSEIGLESTLRAFNRIRQEPLRELYLNVTVLTPGVVETIVRICPNLVKLDVVYGTLCPEDEFVSWTLKPSRTQAVLAKFIQQIKDRGCHPCPSLTDISLMSYVSGTGLKYHLPLMKVYAGILPSVVSFAGIRDATEEALACLEPKMAFLAAGSGRNAAWN
ncbi:hypothetical protein EST38_g5363 [Candolleomyces aberdarensis]|uniref:F-box domain-containing protein n=1 Tax=Candolleomyces aberdarensis TaxID=2316362 RepID=A0A4Q2DK92_9AGAR|nr:hypothetical protein EST38_g5363 [Candolleomyces aberdarensis]